MPTIIAQGKTLVCQQGANLRQVLLENNIDLYNGKANLINCRGLGTCGTCAVAISSENLCPPNWIEKTRLGLPPHSLENNRRLACQIKVESDMTVTKYEGFWGQGNTVVWAG